jgi:hypothetical protein
VAEWLAIFIIIVGCFLPGRFIITCFVSHGRYFPGGHLAFNFAAFASGVLMLGWLAFLLAEFGWYSIQLFAILWLLLASGLFGLSRSSMVRRISYSAVEQDVRPTIFKSPLIEPAILLLWLLAAGWLFFRPHQFIIGGADAGVYVNLAANIAETGRIQITDPILDNLNPDLYPALLRELPPTENASVIAPYYALPGFYVTDPQAGQITPQFCCSPVS